MLHYIETAVASDKSLLNRFMSASAHEREQARPAKLRAIANNQNRIAVIDQMIKHLVVEKVADSISDAVFRKLLNGSEAEQVEFDGKNHALGNVVKSYSDTANTRERRISSLRCSIVYQYGSVGAEFLAAEAADAAAIVVLRGAGRAALLP